MPLAGPSWSGVAHVLLAVANARSQSALLLSQFAKPALQPVSVQLPPLQPAVPVVTVHVLPQSPQLATSDTSDFSQPLLSMPSQLPKFVLHVLIRQPIVPEHVAVALVREQVVPQPPQLASVSSFDSQPSM